jgi:hypothetical protein
MAKYAKINSNNLVVDLIESDADFVNSLSDGYTYKESFEHSYDESNNIVANVRKIPAGVGMTYDPDNDAFIPEKPYGSWVWNATSWEWDPPIARPTEMETIDEEAGTITSVFWDEPQGTWAKVVRNIPE